MPPIAPAQAPATPTALHLGRGILGAVRLGRRPSESRGSEAPKRPKTQFALFVEEARRQRPEHEHKDLIIWAAKRWQTMDPNERQPFVAAHRKDKERYNREWAAYERKLEASQRDPEKPVWPLSAYRMFESAYIRQQTAPYRKVPSQELAKQAAAQWKEMSEKEKEPYAQRAADLLQAYRADMERYTSSGQEAAWLSRRAARSKRRSERELRKNAKEGSAQRKRAAKRAAAKARHSPKREA